MTKAELLEGYEKLDMENLELHHLLKMNRKRELLREISESCNDEKKLNRILYFSAAFCGMRFIDGSYDSMKLVPRREGGVA